jgi:hypothetical protein
MARENPPGNAQADSLACSGPRLEQRLLRSNDGNRFLVKSKFGVDYIGSLRRNLTDFASHVVTLVSVAALLSSYLLSPHPRPRLLSHVPALSFGD